MSNRIIRDPLYGNINLSVLENNLINTDTFRRLKRIKQLSLAQYEYPSANHTRFEHCVGTCYVTDEIINVLKGKSKTEDKDLLKKYKKHIRIAALLHDIGHTAFSHSIEQILNEHPEWTKDKINHEIAGYEIITGNSPINKLLKSSFSDAEIFLIADIATGDIYKKLNNDQYFLTDIITGDLGSDRIDYLKRDSYHTGLSYGNVEIAQLTSNLCIDTLMGNKRVCVKYDEERKGLSACSFLLIGRQYHFESIAHQQKIRCANVMLKKAFEMFMEEETNTEMIVSNCYKSYDDCSLLEAIKSNKTNKHNVEIDKLINLVKNEKTMKEEEPSFKRIDDFPPQVNFMLQIINQNSESKLRLRNEIESKLRKDNKLNQSDFLAFDMFLNGKKGIPSSLFLATDSTRSCLVFDKAPLIEDLSICLPKLGSLAIYSDKNLDINFYDYVKDIEKIVEDIRSKMVIREEVALLTLANVIVEYYNIKKDIEFKLMGGGIDYPFPAIGRFMEFSNKFLKEKKEKTYDDFKKLRPKFLFSSKLYDDLILLASCYLIDINKKPIAINNKNKPVDLDIYNLTSVQTMIEKYIFRLTTRGLDYIFNILVPSKKCKEYDNLIENLLR